MVESEPSLRLKCDLLSHCLGTYKYPTYPTSENFFLENLRLKKSFQSEKIPIHFFADFRKKFYFEKNSLENFLLQRELGPILCALRS
jgi:hypothetical protein